MRDRVVDTTVRISFNTNDGDGAPVAPSSAFEVADFRIYKDGSATQKTSANGITVTSPFDSLVGLHLIEIDTSNDTDDAGFWALNSEYRVAINSAKTVDGVSQSGVIVGEFRLVSGAVELDSASRLAIWNELTTQSFTADSFGELLIISDGTNGREVKVTGANHIAADVHDVQPDGLSGSTEITAINTFAARVTTGLVADGQVYQFTANMLELGPSGGGGGDATLAKQTEILAAIQGSAVIQVASPNVSGNLVLTQGDDYDGVANPKASWTVTTDYTSGWTVRLTIRSSTDTVIYTNTGSVVSATVVAVTIAAPTGLTMTGCPGQWQGKFDVELTHTSGKKKTIALGVCYINEDQTR